MKLHLSLGALVIGLALSACGSSGGGTSGASSTGTSAGSSTGSAAGSSTGSAAGSATGSTTGPATSAGSSTGTTTGPATSSGASSSAAGTTGTSSGGTTTGPTWTVSTFAGGPPVNGACGAYGADTAFSPQYLGVDSSANVYVTDSNVDQITPAGVLSVLASLSEFLPNAFCVDASGDCFYVLTNSFGGHTQIFTASSSTAFFDRAPSCTDGAVAGDAGVGFGSAAGIAVDSSGNFFVADATCYKVRELSSDRKTISTIAGTGTQGLKNGAPDVAEFSQLSGITIDTNGNLYISESDIGDIREIELDGGTTSSVTAGANSLGGMAVGTDGTIYFSDTQLNEVKAIDPVTRVVTVIAGNGLSGFKEGSGKQAEFNTPAGVGVDLTTGHVFVSDTSNCRIRQLTPPGSP